MIVVALFHLVVYNLVLKLVRIIYAATISVCVCVYF